MTKELLDISNNYYADNYLIIGLLYPHFKEQIDVDGTLFNFFNYKSGWAGQNIIEDIEYYYKNWGKTERGLGVANAVIEYYNGHNKFEKEKTYLGDIIVGIQLGNSVLEKYFKTFDINIWDLRDKMAPFKARVDMAGLQGRLEAIVFLPEGQALLETVVGLYNNYFINHSELQVNDGQVVNYHEVAEVAADWWANKFGDFVKPNLGDDGLNSIMTTVTSLFQGPIETVTEEQILVFKQTLCPLIEKKLLSTGKCRLEMEKFPKGILKQAVDVMGIYEKYLCLPCDTIMDIQDGVIKVNNEVIWPNKEDIKGSMTN